MSFNPVRAKNFYKNRSKAGRRTPPPGSGIKHSEIMRRQGIGVTLPHEARIRTPHGFAAEIFTGPEFTVRSEVFAGGNSTGLGSNKDGDRVYQVTAGSLYVTFQGASGDKEIVNVQPGGNFRAPRGMVHGIASPGDVDVEILVIETIGYAAGWKSAEAPTLSEINEAQLTADTSGAPTARKRRPTEEQPDKAQVAASTGRTKRRRNAKPQARSQSPGGQSAAGGTRLGKNTGSGNVDGVSPMPGGAKAFKD